MHFETAIKLVKAKTHIARRCDWDDDKFIFSQIPAVISLDKVANMQSLPQVVKNEVTIAGYPELNYVNQLCIFDSGFISYYFPTGDDLFANDWETKEEGEEDYE